MARCPDCYSSGSGFFDIGDGKCANCYGTGDEQGILDQIADRAAHDFFDTSLGGNCHVCHGSGECQTCDGTGEVESETSYSAPSSSGDDDDDDSVTHHESSYSGGDSSYSGDYSSSEGRAFSAKMWTVVLLPFVAAFLFIIYMGLAEEKGWPLPGNKTQSTPTITIQTAPSSLPAASLQEPTQHQKSQPVMGIPTLDIPSGSSTGHPITGIYLCSVDSYDPKEWRVTPKTVSHTFDGGKTWHTVWGPVDTSRHIIREMRTARELGRVDIILLIEEP